MNLEALHHFSTCALFGLIWTIQLVHYPAFERLHPNERLFFHKQHTTRITFIVAPLMLIELVTSILLCKQSYDTINLIYLGTSATTWLLTFLLFIPFHNNLRKDFTEENITRLIQANWIRTILWSIAAATILYKANF